MYALITIRHPTYTDEHAYITVRMFNTYETAFQYVRAFSPSSGAYDITENGKGQHTYKFLSTKNGHGDFIEYYITEDVNINAPDKCVQTSMFDSLDV